MQRTAHALSFFAAGDASRIEGTAMPSSMNCGGENGTCATAWPSHSIWTARLAYALACPQNDVTLADIAAL